jgi:3'-phosphoadenosine 5'-phosphosulfate sulfotransferase (PAPS reductase)/FAD synthetase
MCRHLFATGERQFGSNGKALGFKLPKKWMKKFNVQYDEKIGWYSDFKYFKVSERCCDIMKKKPIHLYIKETKTYPYIGTLASDSQQRRASYVKTGCNTYEGDKKSRPLSIWTEDDIWSYIKKNNLDYASIYKKGVHNTGCMFCMFGCHLEKEPNRFQFMKKTHPKLHSYCIEKLNLKEILDFLNIPYE